MNKDIIEMHDTWLTIDSIKGCPNACRYCLLQGDESNCKKPVILATPEEAVATLYASPYYDQYIPICLLPSTDAFLNTSNISYLQRLMELLAYQSPTNPLVFVTKCLIPNDFISFLDKLQKKGIKIMAYLSYSGLSKEYEPNIKVENIRQNFINLSKINIKIFHYFRPFLKANSNPEKITEILDFVHNYTDISLISGLKIKKEYIDKLSFLNLKDNEKEKYLNASSNWPKEAYEYFYSNYNHPQFFFQSNYCAIATANHKPCPEYFNTYECQYLNHCPKSQKEICASIKYDDFSKTKKQLIDLLKKLNKYHKDIEIVEEGTTIIIKNSSISISDAAYLTFKIARKVTVEHRNERDKRFASSLSNGKPNIY